MRHECGYFILGVVRCVSFVIGFAVCISNFLIFIFVEKWLMFQHFVNVL